MTENIITKRLPFFRGDWAIICLCLIGMLWIFSFRNFVYFRDYSILFEGSYRIYLGQMPFRDFGLPMGPGSFLIPALFFKLFGINWNSFLWAQQFENFLFLVVLSKLLRQMDVEISIRRVSLILFSFFYLIFLSQPWYNTSAALYMLVAVSLAMNNRGIYSIFSGVFVGLTILTKQDFGILSGCISYFVLIFHGSSLFICGKNFNNNPIRLRFLTYNVVMFTSAIIFVLGTFIILTDYEQFRYWFNYGQSPHVIREISWSSKQNSPAVAFVLLLIGYFKRNFKIMLSAIFLLAAFITITTSGLYFTHYYFIAFIPIIWSEIFKMKFRWKTGFITIISLTLLLSVAKPIRDVFYIFESIALRQPEHFFFNYRRNSAYLVPMLRGINSFSNKIFAPQETIDEIIEIKTLIKKLREKYKVTSPLVLNMTELTTLYLEIGVEPPIGMPLWFNTNVSLFPEQIDMLARQFSETRYDVILLQGTHEGLTPTYQDFLSILNANDDYKLLSRVKNTPSNATWPCEPNCDADIYIYAKRIYTNIREY